MLVEDIKKDFNNSLKEIQENTAKEVEVLKEIQENTTKQVMELNKTIQDLKREVDTIEKTQSEGTLEMETISGKRGPLVLQTFYASVQGNARAKKWDSHTHLLFFTFKVVISTTPPPKMVRLVYCPKTTNFLPLK